MSDRVHHFESRLLEKECPTSLDTENHGDDDSSGDDIDVDELLDDIDNDSDFLEQYREKRMQQISDHLKLVDKNVREQGYGKLETLEDEAQLMNLSSKCSTLIVHLMLDKFDKCQYMNEKLAILARKYLTTKFVKINVENCPFLVQKLKVKVLPFVIGYHEGRERLRSIGFAKLGNDPSGFPIGKLERLLKDTGVVREKTTDNAHCQEYRQDDSSESDLDE